MTDDTTQTDEQQSDATDETTDEETTDAQMTVTQAPEGGDEGEQTQSFAASPDETSEAADAEELVAEGDDGLADSANDDGPTFETDAEYEEQEWTFGKLEKGEIEVQGMKFRVEEPSSDEDIERILMGEGGMANNLREVVDTLVVAPAITDERWNEQMTPKERALLAGEAMDWFGIDDFIDEEQLQQAAQQQAGGPAGAQGGPRGATGPGR